MRQPIPLRIFHGPADNGRGRDTSRPVMLVGFQHQGNLGLGYLAAVLRQYGYAVHVVDIEQEPEEILKTALEINPVLIGFSLIFQFFIDRYAALLEHLRANGVACHFTMGGHFASLSYEQTLNLAPDLDSVVRFEGEMTLVELVDAISVRQDLAQHSRDCLPPRSGSVCRRRRAPSSKISTNCHIRIATTNRRQCWVEVSCRFWRAAAVPARALSVQSTPSIAPLREELCARANLRK